MLSNDVTVKVIFPSEVGKLIACCPFFCCKSFYGQNKYVRQVEVVKRTIIDFN